MDKAVLGRCLLDQAKVYADYAKNVPNMQKICKKYAKYLHNMQKCAKMCKMYGKNCKNMQKCVLNMHTNMLKKICKKC